MSKVVKFVAANLLAFGSFLFPSVAFAQDIWWAQESPEGSVVTITAPDGWQFVYARAWYGDPNDWACGADVSEILKAIMFEKTTVTVALDNGTFGDPCGGVYKVTRFTWGIVPIQQVIPVEPTPMPSPEPVPTIEPSPTPEPSPSPVVIPPIVVPDPPQPVPEPAPPIEEPPVPTPEASTEPIPEAPEPPLPAPEPPVEVVEPPVVIEPPVEPPTPVETPAMLAAAAVADDPEVPQELAAIPLLGDAAVAVLEAFNALGNIGADMAPEVRQTAQETIVASVIVSNIATSSVMASAASYRRMK